MNQPWPGPVQAAAVARIGLEAPWEPTQARDTAEPGTRSRAVRTATVAFATTLAVCAVAYPFLPRRYEAAAAIVLQPTDIDGQADRSLRQPLDENALQSEVDLASAPGIVDAVIRAHNLDRDPEFAGGRGLRAILPGWGSDLLPARAPRTAMELRRSLAEHLQVSRDRKSYTVRLGFWSEDPAKAAALSATLLAAYLDAQRDRKRAGLSWLTDWLGERASTLTGRYEAARRTLDERLAASGLLDTGAQVELDQRLQVLAVEAAQARGRLVEATARSQGLGAMKEAGLLDQAPEILASPVVLKLKDSLAAAMSRTAVWSTETTAIERQIAIESDRIVASAAVEVRSWETREAMLGNQVAETRRSIERRRAAERAAAELQRTADAERLAMDEGLVRLKAMTARTQVVEPDATVIGEPEVASAASFPRPLPTSLAALAMAILAAFAASWREALALAGRIVRA